MENIKKEPIYNFFEYYLKRLDELKKLFEESFDEGDGYEREWKEIIKGLVAIDETIEKLKQSLKNK